MSDPDWFEPFFGADYFEIYRDFFTPEGTAADVEGIVALLGLAPGARVLDLACGYGRHVRGWWSARRSQTPRCTSISKHSA